ncbi:sugar ABC transporter ATP-binding protein [Variovorax sp. ZS18.2.2]|uniref:sugar ABC transporter ATP-binding protein n=1 Tax=Variovorax sp. ZS18.2.2 TaxID=2971255 RepID=UPI002151A86B|nr:sugar ABC transporter ATP-binding protein [Variovorax sp. ZS18.2.2]MCR6476921.1 sugar ABC transporter ATP-binding protein [Variovorax sp. ZS18.2.2]
MALPAVPPLLKLRGISKSFSGVPALRDVSIELRAGEVLALMGENGAGKSTLIKTMTGAYTADPGGIFEIDGKPVSVDSPEKARALGIAVIYQELSLAPNLSVAENVFLGRPLLRRGQVDRKGMERACGSLLERLGADFTAATTVDGLSIAQRQLVEIARALQFDARVLIMDEPTTPLSERETVRLFALIHKLRAEGLAILYISHRMAEIYELADRVSVLRDGRYIGTLEREDISHEQLVRMMVGRDASTLYQRAAHHAVRGPVVLEVSDMADGRRVRGCSLQAHAGEILGIAGLVGSGRTELARLVFGAEIPVRGEVRIGGVRLAAGSPDKAIRAGLVYLTEDRKGQGLFLDASILENINVIAARRDAFGPGILNRGQARFRAGRAEVTLGIRSAGMHVNVGRLSGGNQQKVLLARLLELSPRVLILDEPTRGVDIGAKAEIYRTIDALAGNGAAVVVISSDLPEITGIADRILVMRDGRIAGEVGRGTATPATQETVIALATAQGEAMAA